MAVLKVEWGSVNCSSGVRVEAGAVLFSGAVRQRLGWVGLGKSPGGPPVPYKSRMSFKSSVTSSPISKSWTGSVSVKTNHSLLTVHSDNTIEPDYNCAEQLKLTLHHKRLLL